MYVIDVCLFLMKSYYLLLLLQKKNYVSTSTNTVVKDDMYTYPFLAVNCTFFDYFPILCIYYPHYIGKFGWFGTVTDWPGC